MEKNIVTNVTFSDADLVPIMFVMLQFKIFISIVVYKNLKFKIQHKQNRTSAVLILYEYEAWSPTQME
jgi:hypothetical protein